MKRIMGIDYGDARTGVAVSDLLCSLVGTTKVIHSRSMMKTVDAICEMVKGSDIGEIVVGLPKNMDGTEGERAEVIRTFAAMLPEYTSIPYDFYDERMTTMVAYRFLGETGTYGKKRKDAVDTLSAQIILQGYIDRERMAGRKD